MIGETLDEIESRLRGVGSIDAGKREELLGLLTELKSEVAELSKTRADHATSITSFAHVSAHEATRTDGNPQLLDLAVRGLSSSAEEFESSHPRLVEVVNSICHILSNLGI